MEHRKNASFYTLLSVFFFWGFVAASNGIFIPFCKKHFNLSQFQSQLIDSAFYGAYFIGSLILWLASQASRVDFINKFGYKKGIITGLMISIAGALLMIPAVNSGSFGFILSAFFTIALGFSLQQTTTQPFVIGLGTPETGAHRLNLGGGINSFGTLLGPVIVSLLLFGSLTGNSAKVEISTISILYIILAIVFGLAAVLLSMAKLPVINSDEKFEPGWGALAFPQLRWAMLAIFVYVGVEVTIQSNLGALLILPEFGGYDEAHNSAFISMYWGSLMIGRWTGAISAYQLKKSTKKILTTVIPLVAYGIILLVNELRGSDMEYFHFYIISVFILIAGFYFSGENPFRTLLVFSLLASVAMLTGIFFTGKISVLAFISGGLCCSIMWPCIFSMGLTGLGKYTSQGSAFLIMMILGGAAIPPLHGWIADKTDIHSSYWITVVCFAFLAFFALHVQRILKNQKN